MPLPPRIPLVAVAAVLLLPLVPAVTVAADQRPANVPNVVLVLADDLGGGDLACYGSTYHRTPNLDRLASQGMRFTQAYAACPVCSPTRASILAGKSPARLHLTDWLPGRGDMPSQKLRRPVIEQHLPANEVTIAAALKPAGYASASIGKWHLGGPGFLPEQVGFDLNVAGTAAGSPKSYFSPYKVASLPDGPNLEYLTDRLTDEAVKFIRDNKDRPFFLYLPHFAVHIPLGAPDDLVEEYRKRAKPDAAQNNPIYAAMVQRLDASVGRLMQTLDELKLADDTILIFTSDNGGLSTKEGPNTPATSNAPFRAGKGYLYEGGVREPLIVRWPGAVKAGATSDTPVISTDLYPTILEACGVKPAGPTDGVSLLPVLKQSGGLPDRDLYWHYPHYSNQGGKPGGAIRRGDWKLIEFYEDMRVELYNLKDDAGERADLAAQEPEKTKQLRTALADWRRAVDAQMPTPNPAYKPPAAGGGRSGGAD